MPLLTTNTKSNKYPQRGNIWMIILSKNDIMEYDTKRVKISLLTLEICLGAGKQAL